MSKLYGKKQKKKYSADKQAYQNQIRQVRNDIATNIDDVKAIWKETEKKYSADKQAYQNQIQDNIQKSETDIKSHINEKIVQIENDIATNMDQSNANLEKEISQVRNDIATNIDDVKAIWKETEKI